MDYGQYNNELLYLQIRAIERQKVRFGNICQDI
ncbi:MAG: hypothetical protein JWQ54_666 [Mucilaginibacter sp.]|nr:hypothetical protein [Mucilaginibacter sp.]